MSSENSITKKMLAKLREGKFKKAEEAAKEFIVETKEEDNFLTRSKILMEEAVNDKKKPLTEANEDTHGRYLSITKNTPQFGDVRVSQEETLRKTIGENITLEDNALLYYPDADDLVLNGKINALNLTFQYRYQDTSGDGVYVWTDGLQLTESNARTLGKIRDAFQNWKDSITQDGDLMAKLKMAANREQN